MTVYAWRAAWVVAERNWERIYSGLFGLTAALFRGERVRAVSVARGLLFGSAEEATALSDGWPHGGHSGGEAWRPHVGVSGAEPLWCLGVNSRAEVAPGGRGLVALLTYRGGEAWLSLLTYVGVRGHASSAPVCGPNRKISTPLNACNARPRAL